jgi:hypothetical protein
LPQEIVVQPNRLPIALPQAVILRGCGQVGCVITRGDAQRCEAFSQSRGLAVVPTGVGARDLGEVIGLLLDLRKQPPGPGLFGGNLLQKGGGFGHERHQFRGQLHRAGKLLPGNKFGTRPLQPQPQLVERQPAIFVRSGRGRLPQDTVEGLHSRHRPSLAQIEFTQMQRRRQTLGPPEPQFAEPLVRLASGGRIAEQFGSLRREQIRGGQEIPIDARPALQAIEPLDGRSERRFRFGEGELLRPIPAGPIDGDLGLQDHDIRLLLGSGREFCDQFIRAGPVAQLALDLRGQ